MCLSDGDQTRSVHNLVVVFGHARGTNWFNPSLDSKVFFWNFDWLQMTKLNTANSLENGSKDQDWLYVAYRCVPPK